MEYPYPDEAPSSFVLRQVARGRLSPNLIRQAQHGDLNLPNDFLQGLLRYGVSEVALSALSAQGLVHGWPRAGSNDLDGQGEGDKWIAKACEHCLANDASQGRDHYIRKDWRLMWRISCREHGQPLTALTSWALVPVEIDGVRTHRVRLLRQFESTTDRFLRRSRAGALKRSKIHAAARCLEDDLDATLRGSPLPDIWCLGEDWEVARNALLVLSMALLSPSRGGSQRLIHWVCLDQRIPPGSGGRFSAQEFGAIGAYWQLRLIEALGHVLIDPARYDRVLEGQRYNANNELLYGGLSQMRANIALARMALSDPFAVIMRYADDQIIDELDANLVRFPGALAARIRAAAAIALHSL